MVSRLTVQLGPNYSLKRTAVNRCGKLQLLAAAASPSSSVRLHKSHLGWLPLFANVAVTFYTSALFFVLSSAGLRRWLQVFLLAFAVRAPIHPNVLAFVLARRLLGLPAQQEDRLSHASHNRSAVLQRLSVGAIVLSHVLARRAPQLLVQGDRDRSLRRPGAPRGALTQTLGVLREAA